MFPLDIQHSVTDEYVKLSKLNVKLELSSKTLVNA